MKQFQHEEGREEAAWQVREALLHIHFEERGLSWKAARDLARVTVLDEKQYYDLPPRSTFKEVNL